MIRLNKHGFALIMEIVLVVLVLSVVGFVSWQMFGGGDSNTKTNSEDESASPDVTWSFNGEDWQSSGIPPECPDPLLVTPVDISKATSILYPGQYRGEDYKAHGGFRFKDGTNNSITVKAPLDAKVYMGSRYIEQGEVQYFFVMIAPCGMMYRFDHLLTLSPTWQAIAETLPEAKVDDSRTTNLSPAPTVKAGDTIATAVGFKKTGNSSVDFGLYDLTEKNEVSQTAKWQKDHPDEKEFGQYGVCWLAYLIADDKATAKSLPGGGTEGKTSDYCE